MKNKELIEKLKKLPLDADIVANIISYDTYPEWFDIASAYSEKDENTVIIEIA